MQQRAVFPYPPPGTVVYVFVGPFKHPGIVTDRGWGGAPTIVSNSLRSGGTYEEAWSTFAGHRTVHIDGASQSLPSWRVVANARSMIGRRWNLLTFNCEHFITAALGVRPHSPQLRAAGWMTALGAVAVLASRSGE